MSKPDLGKKNLPKPRTIELVRRTHQPTKAEMEEEHPPLNMSLDDAVQRLLEPVDIRWLDKPKRRP